VNHLAHISASCRSCFSVVRPWEDALQPKINNSQHGATLHSRSKEYTSDWGKCWLSTCTYLDECCSERISHNINCHHFCPGPTRQAQSEGSSSSSRSYTPAILTQWPWSCLTSHFELRSSHSNYSIRSSDSWQSLWSSHKAFLVSFLGSQFRSHQAHPKLILDPASCNQAPPTSD
jgi:hypothetical protein